MFTQSTLVQYLDGTIVYCYCQWRPIGLSGRLLVSCGNLSLILWNYYTSVNSHLSVRARRSLKTTSNVTKNATGHNIYSFSHLPPLQPVLSPFVPPRFIHLSTTHSLSYNIPFHTQFYSPIILIACCPRHVLVVILFFLSRSFSGRYLEDLKLKISVNLLPGLPSQHSQSVVALIT